MQSGLSLLSITWGRIVVLWILGLTGSLIAASIPILAVRKVYLKLRGKRPPNPMSGEMQAFIAGMTFFVFLMGFPLLYPEEFMIGWVALITLMKNATLWLLSEQAWTLFRNGILILLPVLLVYRFHLYVSGS